MADFEKQAIKIFEDLVNSFAALTFSELERQKYELLLQRTMDAIKKTFGDESPYLKEVNRIKFYYARASRGNREGYFSRDKSRMTGLLDRILDDLRLSQSKSSTSNPLTSPTQRIANELAELIRQVSDDQAVSTSTLPVEIQGSLKNFQKDHPDPTKVSFVMMRFSKSKAHEEIFRVLCETLKRFGIEGLRADSKQYHDDLFANILTYMYGCGFGIAVFERITIDEFNPNVSLEVGYMLALKKPVCLLKDETLRTLHTDLIGKLYRVFDPQDISQAIPRELSKWLTDKNFSLQI